MKTRDMWEALTPQQRFDIIFPGSKMSERRADKLADKTWNKLTKREQAEINTIFQSDFS